MPAKTTVVPMHRNGACERVAMEETYFDCVEVIDQTCAAFVARYGGDYAEVRANADMSFIKAYRFHTANPKRGFLTEVRQWVWMEEFDRMRTARQYRRRDENKVRCHTLDSIAETVCVRNPGTWLVDFIDGLTADARAVVALVLDTPGDIAAVMRAKGGSDGNARSTIRQHLRSIGWSADRVRLAFEEVAGALA